MKLSTLWLFVGLTIGVSGQSNALLSVLISDAVSIFTSITSAVGSQVSAVSTSDSTPTTTDDSSSTTSTSATPSSTSATSFSSTSSTSSTITSPAATSSSAAPIAANNGNNSHHDRNLAIILGTVLGALVLGFLILFLLLLCRRRRRHSKADKRYKAYNSSSEDMVIDEKSSRHRRRSSSLGRQPRIFQQYHRGPQSIHKSDRYPTNIPAAHGMSDDPFVPGVSSYPRDGRMHDHEHGMFLNVDDKHLDHGHYERVPLAAGLGGVALGGNNRGYQRTSRAPSIGPDEYPQTLIQPPPRSPLRLSMDSTERRRRSASLGREAAPTPPHHVHDPMPKSTGLTAGALAASHLQREKRRSRSQPRYSDPTPSGLVSPIMKTGDNTAVHEIGDSSDDRDIDRLRRTGTLSQGPKSRPKITELHELSSTGSSNIVPTIGNMSENRNDTSHNHRQSYPPYSSAAAAAARPGTSLYPAPLDESQWMHKNLHNERSNQIPPVDHTNLNQRSNPLGSNPVLEADRVNLQQNHTPSVEQGSHNPQLPEGSLLVSGILKIIDKSNEPQAQPNTKTQAPPLNRTSTEERRRTRAKRRSGSEFKPPAIFNSSSSNNSNTEPVPTPPANPTTFSSPFHHPTSQSNTSQPLRSKPPHHLQPPSSSSHLLSSAATVAPVNPTSSQNPDPNLNLDINSQSQSRPRPQLIDTTTPHQQYHHPSSNEYNNIPHQGLIGRWNSRGRWKSTENIHDDVVGQAL